MQKITVKQWLLFMLIAGLGFGLWFKFGYHQFSFVDLSIDKKNALLSAQRYLDSLGINAGEYSKAIIFDSDDWADRYLQKTIGFKGEEEFIKKNSYELFSWNIRFFRQSQKEEFLVKVSPKTGNILSFTHLVEDIAPSATIEKDAARKNAEDFLKSTLAINLTQYDFHEERIKRYEKRIDYSFSWEKKSVYIPWKENEGGAKLLVGATISGNEVKQFYRDRLDIPEKFQRYIEKQLVFGEYLYSFYYLIFIFLITASIFVVVKRKSYAISRLCKKFYIYLAAIILVINIALLFNNFQNLLYNYPTSVSFSSFIGIFLIKTIINLVLSAIVLTMVGMAGESLHHEVFNKNPYSSFSHYLRSTFFARSFSRAVFLGYCLFAIILGLQAFIFYLGQKYAGVWKEWYRLAQFSSACVPFLSAFVIGITASLNEEIIFRLFATGWAKKYFKNTVFAVIFVSIIWGFGHSEYAIFPVWFRGIEVSIIGLIYGFIFVRFGIIPLIVAHYLFDCYWGIAAYILAKSSCYLFIGSIFVLAIPAIFAIITYFVDKEEKEKEIKLILDNVQKYNLGVVAAFIAERKSQGMSAASINKELIAHNWDPVLVELAINETFKL